MGDYIQCFSCGATCLNIEGETHKYMLSTPGCWAMYGEVLAREYSDMRYAKSHHLTVDCYACQHPGEPVRQSVNSIGIHLSSLCMILEGKIELHGAATFKQTLAQYNKQNDLFYWLSPPENLGKISVQDMWEVSDPAAHHRTALEWAHSVWEAWSPYHAEIKHWIVLCKS